MRLALVVIVIAVASLCVGISAQTRTPWQMHNGIGAIDGDATTNVVHITCTPVVHGDICEYDVALIPAENDPGWFAAPDPDIIDFHRPSLLCDQYIGCAPGNGPPFAVVDFTYFQTLVAIPADVVVDEFSITFSGMDDGSRVSIFNSEYPTGLVVPGSYVFLGGTGTTNLGPYVVSGEVNRVVVTQVDDCCAENNLREARVVLNGDVVGLGCNHDDSNCDDGDPCTVDTCNDDGSCSHTPLDCNDGNPCTVDTCNDDGSCSHTPLDCDDGNACTVDSCDATTHECVHDNRCPDCSAAHASSTKLWPPNHGYETIRVQGVTDPHTRPVTIVVTTVRQDEETNRLGDGDQCPDAKITAGNAQIRRERSGTADGRVYYLTFTATNSDGYSCQGTVQTCVPVTQGGDCVAGGPLYDSLVCT